MVLHVFILVRCWCVVNVGVKKPRSLCAMRRVFAIAMVIKKVAPSYRLVASRLLGFSHLNGFLLFCQWALGCRVRIAAIPGNTS